MIGTDSPIINSVTLVVENVVGLYHPWTLSPKVIQIFLSLICGFQVVADDDDAVLIERSDYDDDDILIKRSEYDDDVLIERSEYDYDDVLI